MVRFVLVMYLALLAEAQEVVSDAVDLPHSRPVVHDGSGLPQAQRLYDALGEICARVGVCRAPRKSLLNLRIDSPEEKDGARRSGALRVAVLAVVALFLACELARALRDFRRTGGEERRKKD